MNFGPVISALKEGLWARRSGWNGKNMHIYLEEHFGFVIPVGHHKGAKRDYRPCVILFTPSGHHQPGWVC